MMSNAAMQATNDAVISIDVTSKVEERHRAAATMTNRKAKSDDVVRFPGIITVQPPDVAVPIDAPSRVSSSSPDTLSVVDFNRIVRTSPKASDGCHGNDGARIGTNGCDNKGGGGSDAEIHLIVSCLLLWPHEQRCLVLERLLRESQLSLLRSLWTTLQPALHRDFTYAAQRVFPSINFQQTTNCPASDATENVKLDTDTGCTDAVAAAAAAAAAAEPVVVQQRTDVNTPRTVRSNGVIGGLTRSKTTVSSTGRDVTETRPVTSRGTPRLPSRARTQIGSMGMTSSRVTTASSSMRLLDGEEYIIDEERMLTPAQVIHYYRDRWTASTRNAFFTKLLKCIDERQIFFLSNFLAQRLYCDIVALLPRPLAVQCLQYLSVQQLSTASLVSSKWRQLCKNDMLWRHKYDETYPDIPPRVTSHKDHKPVNWRKMFIKTCNVKENWINGKCKRVDCTGHKGRVLSVTFNRKQLATGSRDRTIKLWDIASGRCVQTLTGHVKGVWSVLFYTDNLLVSGSYDSSIKVWNLRQGRCIRSLLGHLGPIWAMVLRSHILVSVSQDKTAKVWDISRCLALHSLEGHREAVFAVDMDEKDSMIFTGSADKTVRLWSSVTGELLRTVLVSPTTSVMSIVYSNGYMACCYGTTICIYVVAMKADIVGGIADVTLLRQYREHLNRIENLQLKVTDVAGEYQGTLISAGKDAVIKYWDLSQDDSVQTFNGHSEQINCVFFDSTRMASASYDNTVKIWDFYGAVR